MPARKFVPALVLAALIASPPSHADENLFSFSQSVVDPASGRSLVISGVCRRAPGTDTRSLSAAGSARSGLAAAVRLDCGLSPTPLFTRLSAREPASVWDIGGTLVSVTPPPLAVYQLHNNKPVYVMECNEDGSYCKTTFKCWEDASAKQSICEPV